MSPSAKPNWFQRFIGWCQGLSSRALGGICAGAAFILTIVIAFIPASESWGVTLSVALVLIGGGLQFGGARFLDKSGRADPMFARSAIRRLILLAAQAERARVAAEDAYAEEAGPQLQASVGRLSVALSYLQEGISASAEDWALVHPDAIKPLKVEDQAEVREASI